jgi:hypothetical protein
MTDETSAASATPDAPPEPTAEAIPIPTPASPTAEAWSDVVARMSELGTALSAWAKSAADDPQNKQRLESVRAGVDEMARQADVAFGKVTSSDFGQQVSQGAQQAGDAIGGAAQQVSDAAAPHVATALSGLAGVFGRAAAKVDEAVNRDRTPETPAADATPSPAAAAPADAPADAPAAQPVSDPDEQS